MSNRVHRTTDRTTNLLTSFNVHYVHLGGDNNGVITYNIDYYDYDG